MTTKITKKIVKYSVVTEDPPATPPGQHLHEGVARPDRLMGTTYKIKTPLSEHALYVTINDILLNEGTPAEQRHPFEIFINSKNMDHFQWIVALTRVISAVFRKGGDIEFLTQELRSVFDPKGGYFKKGGKYMPSLVAEIGDAIESHLVLIGVIKPVALDAAQQAFVDSKRGSAGEVEYPANAELCTKCGMKAVTRTGGCTACLACSDSKCG